jgi:hypothetical protein
VYTLATITLVILGAWVAGYWLLPAFGIWGIAAWVATLGGALDTDNLSAWLFTLGIVGILAEIFI